MSKMKSDHHKPPLAKSPIRLRPRRVLRSNPNSMQSPAGSLTKSQKPNRTWDMEESELLRPEYRSISCELRALARMVRDEFGNEDSGKASFGNSLSAKSNPLFERGRFYEEYSARRNERLKRKKGETGKECKSKSAYKLGLGVNVESAKRNTCTRKLESRRKSVSAAFSSVEPETPTPTPTPRYMLRSLSKENKKPPLAQPVSFARGRKFGAPRVVH